MNYSIKNLLFFCFFLFFLFFTFLAFYNRFAADDYLWMYMQRSHNIIGCVKFFYYSITGRWTANLMLSSVYKVEFAWFPFLAIFNVASLLFFLWANYQLLGAIAKRYELNIAKSFVFLQACMFTLFYFFITAGNGEIWFWTCGSPHYLWSIILMQFVAAILLKKEINPIEYLMVAVLSLYIGGAAESFVCVYLLLEIVAFFRFQQKNKVAYFLSIIFMLAGFITSTRAPGNAIRATWLPQPSFLHGMVYGMKTSYHLIADGWVDFMAAIICFLPFFILTGNFLREKLQFKMEIKPLGAIIIFGILSAISFFPTCYFLSDDAPKRACELAYFLIAFFIFITGFSLGLKVKMQDNQLKTLGYVAPLLIGLLVIINSVVEIPIAANYAKANDARIALLKQIKDSYKEKVYKLEPLPKSGMLFSSEISSDTTYWVNQQLKKGLELNFSVTR